MYVLFQGFSVRQVELKRESSSVYVTLGFAGIALVAAMVVGVVVLKRRNGRHPHHQVRPFLEATQRPSLAASSASTQLLRPFLSFYPLLRSLCAFGFD